MTAGLEKSNADDDPRRRRGGRWSRLCLKELREILRDRRTLVTLILMPLLVYPILSMVFQRSLMSAWSSSRSKSIVIGVKSEQAADQLRAVLIRGDAYLKQKKQNDTNEAASGAAPTRPAEEPTAKGSVEAEAETKSRSTSAPGSGGLQDLVAQQAQPSVESVSFFVHEDLAEAVRSEKVDLGILTPDDSESRQVELIYRDGSALSTQALRLVEQSMQAMNEFNLRERLRRLGRSGQLMFEPLHQPIIVASTDTTLSTIVPMILILMTVTGAVYPAIDLTAGERERGTLEMLMASPVPRLKLLLAKYVAVVTVAFLTALVNLVAMTITLRVTGLSEVLFGESGLNLQRVGQILALLVLFAAFFSAVLLALTSFARSFKEAQAYLIPLMLLSLGPGVVSLLPGLQLSGLLAITPISNMVLLARDLCGAGADPLMAAVAVLSTSLYTLAAIAVAARVFGADAVLASGQTQWRDLLVNPAASAHVSSVGGALFCLAVLFPIYFITSNGLGQLRGLPLNVRLVLTGVATSLLFGAVPWIAARLQRLNITAAFQLRQAPIATFLFAVVLGLTLWPIAHEIFFLNQLLGLATIRQEQLDAVQNLLEDWREISPVWILLSMAIAPAVFEEFFFRGYLFSALRAGARKWTTILASSVLFGLFHVISTSALSTERFLPSTFLGLILGWVCYRTRSILPGICLHACHNGLLLMIAYYRDELAAAGWGVEEESHLPTSWIATSLVSLLVSGIVISLLTRGRKTATPSSSVEFPQVD